MTYEEKVKKNIKYLNSLTNIKDEFEKKEYLDPDYICETVTIDGIDITLSTDGLCSINKIINFSEPKEMVSNYELIRGTFLRWPAYAMSINQQRGYKNPFDDRIDRLLVDIQTFYDITNGKKELNNKIIREIVKNCKLCRAYLNMFTLIWLRHFDNFDNFVKENSLERFVEFDGNHYKAKKWVESEKLDQEYFNVLITRIK